MKLTVRIESVEKSGAGILVKARYRDQLPGAEPWSAWPTMQFYAASHESNAYRVGRLMRINMDCK